MLESSGTYFPFNTKHYGYYYFFNIYVSGQPKPDETDSQGVDR